MTEGIYLPDATPSYCTAVRISVSTRVTKSRTTPLALIKLLLEECYGCYGYTIKAGGGPLYIIFHTACSHIVYHFDNL